MEGIESIRIDIKNMHTKNRRIHNNTMEIKQDTEQRNCFLNFKLNFYFIALKKFSV